MVRRPESRRTEDRCIYPGGETGRNQFPSNKHMARQVGSEGPLSVGSGDAKRLSGASVSISLRMSALRVTRLGNRGGSPTFGHGLSVERRLRKGIMITITIYKELFPGFVAIA